MLMGKPTGIPTPAPLHAGTFVTVGNNLSQLYGYNLQSPAFGSYTNSSGGTVIAFFYSIFSARTDLVFSGSGNISDGENVVTTVGSTQRTMTWNGGLSRYTVAGDPFGIVAANGTSPNWSVTVTL
jgi:hypothetical protein